MNVWIAAAVRYNGTFGENAKSAGTVTLLGMATIFAVLALLWGVVQLLHLVMPKQKEKKPKAQTAETQVAPAVEKPTEDDGAIVAAITAAILAARTEEGITTGFRVVSFRRAGSGKRTGN
jgi:sodium pump decarboxylase gamma subunit